MMRQLPVCRRRGVVKGEYALGQVLDVLNHHLVRSVIHQDVDLTHRLQRLVNDLLAVLPLRQVRREQVALAALLLDQPLRLLRVALLLRQVHDEAVGALHGVEHSGGTSDAAVTARDDGFLAFELAGSFVELLAAIFGGNVVVLGRGTLHLGLQPRRLLL